MIKVFLIGCVEFSKKCFEAILKLEKQVEITGIATKEYSSFNSDFCDLAPSAISRNIPFLYVRDINSPQSIDFIKSCNPDLICCLGWSSIIKQPLLNLYPIIGYHPAELPKNRGRHPLIWALVLGLKQTASTYFLIDSGTDSGNILSQEIVPINFDDNARSMYDKLSIIAINQLQTLLLVINKCQKNKKSIYDILVSISIPQNHEQSNVWRKRSKNDGIIDFRMSSLAIYNLVRAITYPYPGAQVRYRDQFYCIWETKIMDYQHRNIEPGKILEIQNEGILVKTFDGTILITRHELPQNIKAGEYL